MKELLKKHISLLLAAVLIIASVSISIFVFADDDVAINEDNFPDKNFRAAVSFMYDTDNNGYLSKAERSTETMIVSGIIELYAFEHDLDEDSLTVNNLKGIEYFENLKSLRCSSVGTIVSLDLSSLYYLESLACNDLGMQSIILPSGSTLKNISICSNELDFLDFRQNTGLTKIHCYSNEKLEAINISGLSELEELRCDCCALKSLDLSDNTKLSFLNCSYNNLIKLDLNSNSNLVSGSNSITEYNIGHQTSSAYVTVENGLIAVPLELEADRVVSTSLDTDDNIAFSDGCFYTDSFDNMLSGIDYSYNTGISDSAFLTVHLDVTENEHFYSLINFDFVHNEGDISCLICGDNHYVSFADSINARIGDENYDEFLDVVDDGIINAKDFSKIVLQFNT